MKICYVVHQFLPRYFTGTEQYAFSVAREMAGRGHDVRVFTLDPRFGDEANPFVLEQFEVEGLPVTQVRFWNRLHRDEQRLEHQHPYLGLCFGRDLDRDRPDLVHFFHLRFLGANLLDEARQRGLATMVHLMDFWFLCPRVILTQRDGTLCDGPPDGGMGCLPCVDPALDHEVEQLGLRQPLARLHAGGERTSRPGKSVVARAAALLERPVYLQRHLEAADCVIAPSRFLAEVFVRNGYDGERIQVAEYGIDPARLAGALDPASPPPPTLTLGFIGSLAPHKGLHVLLRALEEVRGDVRLEVYGRVDDFPDYARPLQERAERDPRIEFRGPFARDELGSVLARLSALVVPSQWYENTPFVVLEAQAAGLPVLASDLGGIAEIVEQEVNGELFPRDDAPALAHRLQRLVDEPERLAGYRAAIGPVRTLQQNADQIEELYGKCLTDAPSHGAPNQT